MERKCLMRLNKEQAADSQRLHHLMCCQMGIFEMLKCRARDNDVKAFLADYFGQSMDISNDIDVPTGLHIGAEVLGGVGNPFVVFGRSTGDGLLGAKFENTRAMHSPAASDELLQHGGAVRMWRAGPGGKQENRPA